MLELPRILTLVALPTVPVEPLIETPVALPWMSAAMFVAPDFSDKGGRIDGRDRVADLHLPLLPRGGHHQLVQGDRGGLHLDGHRGRLSGGDGHRRGRGPIADEVDAHLVLARRDAHDLEPALRVGERARLQDGDRHLRVGDRRSTGFRDGALDDPRLLRASLARESSETARTPMRRPPPGSGPAPSPSNLDSSRFPPGKSFDTDARASRQRGPWTVGEGRLLGVIRASNRPGAAGSGTPLYGAG